MRVLVCGSRDWTDSEPIATVIKGASLVIEGGAKGADFIASHVAQVCFVRLDTYKAKWAEYGKGAGPIRNQQMLDEGKPDVVWAFHDDITNSKGTGDMVRRAKKAGIPVYVVSHP